MVVLLAAGLAGAVLLIYAADRVIKMRAHARRLRKMSVRLAAATARTDVQLERREAAEQASTELTSVMPAIRRPPPTLPGVRPHAAPRPKPGAERCAQPEHRSGQPEHRSGQPDHRPAHPARRQARSGEHGIRPAERSGSEK